MPNWCSNQISITGEKESLDKLKLKLEELVKSKGMVMQTLLELPDQGDEWYANNVENFGTKWDFEFEDDYMLTINDDIIHITVDTAWSPPIPFIESMCKKHNVSATIKYCEPGCDFGGVAEYDPDGLVNEETYPFYEYLYNCTDEFLESVSMEIEWSVEGGTTWEEIKEKFSFVNETTMEAIHQMYVIATKEVE